jgi:hypothetical protein
MHSVTMFATLGVHARVGLHMTVCHMQALVLVVQGCKYYIHANCARKLMYPFHSPPDQPWGKMDSKAGAQSVSKSDKIQILCIMDTCGGRLIRIDKEGPKSHTEEWFYAKWHKDEAEAKTRVAAVAQADKERKKLEAEEKKKAAEEAEAKAAEEAKHAAAKRDKEAKREKARGARPTAIDAPAPEVLPKNERIAALKGAKARQVAAEAAAARDNKPEPEHVAKMMEVIDDAALKDAAHKREAEEKKRLEDTAAEEAAKRKAPRKAKAPKGKRLDVEFGHAGALLTAISWIGTACACSRRWTCLGQQHNTG